MLNQYRDGMLHGNFRKTSKRRDGDPSAYQNYVPPAPESQPQPDAGSETGTQANLNALITDTFCSLSHVLQ